MRILIFSTAYFPFVGGAEVAVREITDRLAPFGGAGVFQFDMVTARMDKRLPKFEKIGNVNVYRIGVGIPLVDKQILAWRGHKYAQKLHNKNKYDIVWSIMASFGGFAASAFKKKNPNVPFLLTLQEGDPIEYINKQVQLVKGKFENIFKRADYVQAISNYLAGWAKDMGAKCSIDVVPNGVDLNSFRVSGFSLQERQEFKKKLNLKNDDKIIITVSRLVKKNAVGDIIFGLDKIKDTKYKLLIAGVGPLESKLKLQVAKLKLQDQVFFLGNVSHCDLPNYLAISDVFIRPSLSEGLGNVFLEAMAVGVPIIGTEVGGIPDFLKDKETGLFCEVNNPKSIAEKIQHILDPQNEELKNKTILNAKKLVQENYDWDKITKRMGEIFEKMI